MLKTLSSAVEATWGVQMAGMISNTLVQQNLPSTKWRGDYNEEKAGFMEKVVKRFFCCYDGSWQRGANAGRGRRVRKTVRGRKDITLFRGCGRP